MLLQARHKGSSTINRKMSFHFWIIFFRALDCVYYNYSKKFN